MRFDYENSCNIYVRFIQQFKIKNEFTCLNNMFICIEIKNADDAEVTKLLKFYQNRFVKS